MMEVTEGDEDETGREAVVAGVQTTNVSTKNKELDPGGTPGKPERH